MLRSVLYRSQATTQCPSHAEQDILRSSKHHNPHMDVTGYLVRTPEHYVQVLEGPADVLDDLLDIIRRDERHHNFEMLRNIEISHRSFGSWSMGYHPITSNTSAKFPNRAATACQLAQQMTDFMENIANTSNGNLAITSILS